MSARFAPVAPPHFLRKLREIGDWAIGRYHLLLAHDVAANPASYFTLLPERSFVIMDNSLVELGKPVETELMEAAFKAVRTSCVVLPDMKDDATLTVELSREFVAKNPHLGPFMAVPQGKSLDEALKCARELVELPHVMYWGAPRCAVDAYGTREHLVKGLKAIGTRYHKGIECIHLLGFSDNLEDDMRCARIQGVMGIDSAVPLRGGQLGECLWDPHFDAGFRGDFWERPVPWISPATIANLYWVRNNIVSPPHP